MVKHVIIKSGLSIGLFIHLINASCFEASRTVRKVDNDLSFNWSNPWNEEVADE